MLVTADMTLNKTEYVQFMTVNVYEELIIFVKISKINNIEYYKVFIIWELCSLVKFYWHIKLISINWKTCNFCLIKCNFTTKTIDTQMNEIFKR